MLVTHEKLAKFTLTTSELANFLQRCAICSLGRTADNTNFRLHIITGN